jgi:hypothetical protein
MKDAMRRSVPKLPEIICKRHMASKLVSTS